MATPIPRELMTLDDWDVLPQDNSAHFELQEGVLIVSPKPARRHLDALLFLAWQVRRQAPAGWQVLIDFEVVVQAEEPATVCAPDIIVVPRGGPENSVEARDALIAVEIISPGSRRIDTVLKAHEYAEAGIPHHWVVDIDPPTPSITVYDLGATGDGYVESQRATGELLTTVPFDLRIDVTGLAES